MIFNGASIAEVREQLGHQHAETTLQYLHLEKERMCRESELKQVRFSHKDYEKFRRIQKRLPFAARLLQVFVLHNADISDPFNEYDTKYYSERGVKYYPLESRVWIVLLFEADNGLLFTTMRRATTPKLQYYRDSQGEQFEIIVRGAQWD
jgi:hypothetical protein